MKSIFGKNKKRNIKIIFSGLILLILTALSILWLIISIKNGTEKTAPITLVIIFTFIIVYCFCILLQKSHGIKTEAKLIEVYDDAKIFRKRMNLLRAYHSGSDDVSRFYASIEYKIKNETKITEMVFDEESNLKNELSRKNYIGKNIPIVVYKNNVHFDYDRIDEIIKQ